MGSFFNCNRSNPFIFSTFLYLSIHFFWHSVNVSISNKLLFSFFLFQNLTSNIFIFLLCSFWKNLLSKLVFLTVPNRCSIIISITYSNFVKKKKMLLKSSHLICLWKRFYSFGTDLSFNGKFKNILTWNVVFPWFVIIFFFYNYYIPLGCVYHYHLPFNIVLIVVFLFS